MTAAWHVARCWAADAKKAVTELADYPCTAFWPRWIIRRRIRTRLVETVHPVLGGYLFLRFDATDLAVWQRLHEGLLGLWLHGFIGGWPPQAVPDQQLQPFIDLAVTPDGLLPMLEDEAPRPLFRPGEIVRLLGPFAAADGGGVEGRVSWADVRGARVITMMFGRQIESYAPNSVIEKLDRAPPRLLAAEGAHAFRRKRSRNRVERLRAKAEAYTPS